MKRTLLTISSSDDGATWTAVEVDGDVRSSSDFMALVPSPGEDSLLFAGGHGLGVVKSADGGATWTRSDRGIDGTDIHGLALNQRNPDYLYAYSVGHGVYRSGRRRQLGPDRRRPLNPAVRSLSYMAVQTDMDRCGWRESSSQLGGVTTYSLATVHSDPSTMYAGTTDGVWKTTDEGQNWQRLDGIDARVAAVSIDLSDARTVVAVTENGEVHTSPDAGATWRRQN